jgi:Histidine kinase-, DNA gyrase B-, and HSP90-like ATPase
MKINLNKAISIFHPNPSYEQVYFESFANALDAGADKISIKIKIDSFERPDTIELIINDNGTGFSDKNFEKFSKLLEVESNNHKGLGRLVYLAYFKEVKIESIYKELSYSNKREFIFNSKFSGKENTVSRVAAENESGSTLYFTNYSKGKVYSYAYLTPDKIKESLVQQFFPLLFKKKELGEKFHVEISLEVKIPSPEKDFYSSRSILNTENIPSLKKTTFKDNALDFYEKFDIYYSVVNDIAKERSIDTAICIDDRALEYDLLPIESIPHGYQLRFLFISGYFEGKINSSRQKLALPDEITERNLKTKLRLEIGKIIEAEIPNIELTNSKVRENLNNKFPHLQGYLSMNTGGLIVKQLVLEEARNKFFSDQQKILECEILDDTQYEKALEFSSRALAEYVMYRTRIISKLKKMTPKNDEKELHKLIVPMRRTLREEEFDDDIYNNNVWILDDRFMSYNTILSDEVMEKVIKEISLDDVEDESRPDITMVFSGNPEEELKVSVVVVELKKHGLSLAKNEEVISQLRQRARKLLKYFPNKIERIWFYGITDIDSEFRISLIEDSFKELFSHGKIFFKSQDIIVDNESRPFKADLFVMTYDSLISDSESRNETFLRILKSSIRKCISS